MSKELDNLLESKIAKALSPYFRSKRIVFVLLSLPILLYCLGFLLTKNRLAPGDADYLIQAFEAMRISIFQYHQFPWWNPWISGGVPLFANPQFGLISLVTPLVILFGSIVGYKLAVITYFIIGFWGFRTLFVKAFRTPVVTATLLSYVWTFGTFLTHRTGGGHFTFLVIQFFPWALLFYLRRKVDKKAWLKFGLITSLMALTAAHNLTIMSYAVLGLIILIDGVRIALKKNKEFLTAQIAILRQDLIFWLKAGCVFILLTSYRLFFTLQYIKDHPRSEVLNLEPSLGPHKAIFAIFGPLRQFANSPGLPVWSWLEASTYISVFTLAVLILVIWVFLKNRKNQSNLFSYSPYLFGGLFLLFFLLSLGDFIGRLSPYSLLRNLPVFSSMRVAPRWLVWCALAVLFFIASYVGRRYRKAINILLALACVELFIYCRPYLARPYVIEISDTRPASAKFEQKRLYNQHRYGIPYDENFTEATMDNYGQIIAGDSLVDTRWPPPWGTLTRRCAIDEGCELVLTKNADVVYWSPNKLALKRKSSGPVQLNMNLGKSWMVNGKYVFLHNKTVDSNSELMIIDPSETLIIQYRPRLSIDWALNKLN